MTDSVHIVQSRKSNKNSSGVIMMKFQKIFFCCCLIGILFCGCENKKDNHLLEAVRAGDLEYITKLLKKSEYNQEQLDEALFCAVTYENIEIAMALLAAGATYPTPANFPIDIDRRTKNIFLAFSVGINNNALVKFLLQNGADANYHVEENITVLYVAIASEHEDSVKLLLKAGADDIRNPNALKLAIMSKNATIVKMLLEKDFDVYSSDIEFAEEKGNQKIIQVLKAKYERQWE